ncbi:MAG: SDR family NAD(P)-dependent oxidoreductase [Limnobacter sp.]|nr:SDR family NAD(P)-dependent oxidoreductase [Limnobacter sp.]
MEIRFDGRVAIVTGAGNGLGRAHAMGLASRGAKVVVNDLSLETAQKVADEINRQGGEAIALAANVADVDQVNQTVATALEKWGRIDILVNNAGILRDKTFAKMDMSDFRLIVDVHLMGSVYFSKAVWEIMRNQNYGRIVMTTSTSGIYGNFGQANYGAAKSGVVGLMNVLAIEGKKNDIRVNSLAPTAATAMTQDLLSQEALAQLAPELITPGLLVLVSENAPTGTILGAGAGCFAVSKMVESDGVFFEGNKLTPENIAAHFADIAQLPATDTPLTAFDQTSKYLKKGGLSPV